MVLYCKPLDYLCTKKNHWIISKVTFKFHHPLPLFFFSKDIHATSFVLIFFGSIYHFSEKNIGFNILFFIAYCFYYSIHNANPLSHEQQIKEYRKRYISDKHPTLHSSLSHAPYTASYDLMTCGEYFI